MRRFNIISILLLASLAVNGQVDKPRNLASFDFKKLHWGFTVGLNSMDFAVKRNPGAVNYRHADVIGFQPAGFQVNIVSDLRLSDYWNLRFLPGINLGSRDFIYFDPSTWDPVTIRRSDGETTQVMNINSSFLDFPLLLKFRSERVNNYRPYVIGGISYRLDMSARKAYDTQEDFDRILLKKSDFYLEAGFGIDQYLKYFKYSTEIKLAVGLRNVLLADTPFSGEEYFTNSIEDLRSFLVMVNFHFE